MTHDPRPEVGAPDPDPEQIQQKIDSDDCHGIVLLRQCGFLGIEVHAMHWAYLLDQFAQVPGEPSGRIEHGGALE
ncbi:MAG: hypothetical protein ACLT9P_06545 [Evtepia gabavorous]